MKLWRRSIRARERSRGVAVLEFTLSLVFLIPLVLAALDFGYYFYVGSTAEEAARQGMQQFLRLAGSCAAPPACNAAVAPALVAATGSGTTCLPGGDAACYMNGPPLGLGGASDTTVTCTCSAIPVNATYTITVQVNFEPAVGYFRYLLPSGGGTKVRYTATLTGN